MQSKRNYRSKKRNIKAFTMKPIRKKKNIFNSIYRKRFTISFIVNVALFCILFF